jgi:flagellar biosynthesis regulator FlaF
MLYFTQKNLYQSEPGEDKKIKSNQKFRLLHAVIITFGLFLINQPNIKQSQENFQQILITVVQDSIADLME